MFRASLCPSSGEQDYVTACVVLRCNKRGKLDISFNVFFVWYYTVNLDGISCVYENVVCKLVCHGVGLVYVSCTFQVWCIGARALMHELCLVKYPSNRHNSCISAPAPIHQTWKAHDTYTNPTP